MVRRITFADEEKVDRFLMDHSRHLFPLFCPSPDCIWHKNFGGLVYLYDEWVESQLQISAIRSDLTLTIDRKLRT